eukprot:15352426-Ditylum_brightwellii.AAC.1
MDYQDEVMSTLITRSKLHLYQAFNTPFETKEMQNYIRQFGTGTGAKEILDEKFNPTSQDNSPAVNYWINNHLWRVPAVDSIDITLKVEELKQLLKKQNE